MADPLYDATETLAPEPPKKRYFDPVPGQTVLSRYGNARSMMGTAAAAAELESRLNRNTLDRMRIADAPARRKHEELVMSDEARQIEARNTAMAKRGEYLKAFSELDPEAEDYYRKVTGIMANMPEGIAEDDGVRAILTFNNGVASKASAARQREREIAARHENTMTQWREKQKLNAGLAGVPDEEIRKAINPDTGELDPFAYGELIGRYSRSYKEGEFNRQQDRRTADRAKLVDLRNASQAARDQQKVAFEAIDDTEAFKPKMTTLREKYPKQDDENLKALYPQEFEAAQAWDKKRLGNERELARKMSVEEFVKAGGNTPNAKAKRRAFWEAARKGYVDEAPDAAAPVTGEPATAPTQGQRKPLTPDVIADFKKRAGGDPRKAMQMAIDEGY